MVKFAAIAFLLAAAFSTVVAEKECGEKKLFDCLHELGPGLVGDLSNLEKDAKNNYCLNIKDTGKCLEEGSKSCQKEDPDLSKVLTAFHAYLNYLCKAEGFENMVSCFKTHKSEFDECSTENEAVNSTYRFAEICWESKSMQCMASLSKKVCKDGEKFAKDLEKHTTELESHVCESGVGILGCNLWILTTALIILFITRGKF